MAVTLYGTYIDYNGDRTFVKIANCAGGIVGNCDFQCSGWNCASLTDEGEQLRQGGNCFTKTNCNCACNC